jgi:hypothetical protein
MAAWNEIWALALENYIFHGIVLVFIAAIVVLVLSFLLRKLFSLLLRLFKKIKFGKLEIETRDHDTAINPATPCPYADSKKRSMEAIAENAKNIAENTKSIESLTTMFREMMAKIDDFRMDQQKSTFWDKNQPLEDQMYGGLKYVANGGNSGTKSALIEMVKAHPDMYRMALKDRPNLRLEGVEA